MFNLKGQPFGAIRQNWLLTILTFILPLFNTSEERIVDAINSNSSMIEKKLQDVVEHPQKTSDSLSIHTSRK